MNFYPSNPLRKLLLFLVLVICLDDQMHAQELQTNKDQFSGEISYITTPAKIYSKPVIGSAANEQLFISFYKGKQAKALVILAQGGRMSGKSAGEADRLGLILKNGDTMTLKVAKIDLKENELANQGSTFSCFYQLEDNQILLLKKSPIAGIHLHHEDKDFDYAITSVLYTDRIKKAVSLIF
jgi:hypothetical protein